MSKDELRQIIQLRVLAHQRELGVINPEVLIDKLTEDIDFALHHNPLAPITAANMTDDMTERARRLDP